VSIILRLVLPDGQITFLFSEVTSGPFRQGHFCKILFFRFSENHDYVRAIPFPPEGRFAIVTDVGSGMRWTWRCARRAYRRGRPSRVVVPLPNEINAVTCLKAITRALNDLAFSQRWLTKLSDQRRDARVVHLSLFVTALQSRCGAR
jgi:hypothetical protein